MRKKGTVTALSSLYPAEEAQKASKRVQDAIAERQQQLNQLKSYTGDNISLINLVKNLPDETHHNIMVPFGSSRGGYYAERTSKQTVEILRRRGQSLETQTESLKAIMQNLMAEATFFYATANESADGFVEIREDYVEEGSSATSTMDKSHNNPPLEVDDGRVATEDDEYARIFKRMAELEKEEEEAEKADESDDDEQSESRVSTDLEIEEEAEKIDESGDDKQVQRQISTDQEDDVQTQKQLPTNQKVRSTLVKTSEVLTVSNGEASHGDYPTFKNSVMNISELPQEENKIQPSFPASTTIYYLQAFSGSIVERAHNIGANFPGQQTGSWSSKPVSRFKMQRK